MTDGPSLETLNADDFRRVAAGRFRLTGQPAADGSACSFQAELVNVTEHAGGSPGAVRTPFSVLFHGPLEPALPQGMCRLEHDELGALDLFIVPIGPNVPAGPGERPSAMRYEAVFG